MSKTPTHNTRIKAIILFLLLFAIQKAQGNINAIDFTKIKYPTQLQAQIDFLRNNDGVYNHWVHYWTASIPKDKAIGNLTLLYGELDKLTDKNVETDLLLGDIAHYLYNMEVEEYYQKAIDQYLAAKAIDPKDYRVYWFLGNHYALSAKQVLSIQTYQVAMKYLPSPHPHPLFWADYAVACANASMLGTAMYAARQSSIISGQVSYIEDQMTIIFKHTIRTPPADTTILSKDMWSFYGKQGNKVLLNNYLLGTNVAIDSTWGIELGDFKDKTAYVTIIPPRAAAKNGRKIGFTLLVLTKVPDDNMSLSQFLDSFTSQYKDRQPVTFNVGNIKNCMAYEIRDKNIYTEIGGGHMYAIAIERHQPEYPGMALEAPFELPKMGANQVNYYRSPEKYGRLKEKLYYLILFDSCEYIHDESFAVFKDFLANGLVIE